MPECFVKHKVVESLVRNVKPLKWFVGFVLKASMRSFRRKRREFFFIIFCIVKSEFCLLLSFSTLTDTEANEFVSFFNIIGFVLIMEYAWSDH